MLCVCVCVRVLSSHFAVWLRVDDPNSNSLVDPSVPPQNRPQSPKIKGAKRAGRYLGLLSLGILGNAPDHLEVLLNHLLYQVVERGAELPSKILLGLGGAEGAGVNLHKLAALIGGITSDLIDGSGLA